MKRDKKQIDDFIKRNLPRVSRKEIDEAGDRVLSRLHREVQDRIDAFRLQAFEPDDLPEWLTRDIGWNWKEEPLSKDEHMALRVVCLLGDQADPSNVFKRAKDLFSDVVAACRVLYGLDRSGAKVSRLRAAHAFAISFFVDEELDRGRVGDADDADLLRLAGSFAVDVAEV